MVETAVTQASVGGHTRIGGALLVAFGLVGCATSGGSGGGSAGSPMVVKPPDDPAAVTRALARVQTDLDDVQRRIEELEQRTRGGMGDGAPAAKPEE